MKGTASARIRAIGLAAGITALAASASAQQAQAPAPAPAPRAGATQAAGRTPQVTPYVVGRAMPPTEPGKRMLDMSLDQAMQMALDKNLSLKVARMNPQSVDYQLQAARAAFNPTFTSLYSYQNAQSPNNSTLEASSNVAQLTNRFNGGVTQPFPWFGGSLSVNFTNSRLTTNSSTALLNPSYTSGLNFTYTQPLLAGFKIDNNRNTLRTLQISREIADIQLLTTIETTKASVRTAYWNLRQSIESIEIQKEALDLAQQLADNNKVMVEVGALAPIDTYQNDVSVANAQQALLNAQIGFQNAENSLRQLLAAAPDDDIYKATINPTEQPVAAVTNVDIDAAVQAALQQRTDLIQAKRNIDSSRLTLEVTQDQLKPSLNLQAVYSDSGQGGTTFDRSGNIVTATGYGGATSQVFGFTLPTWSLQFNMNYPLGMQAAKANYARAQLAVDQSVAQLRASELSVTVAVQNAGLAVQNSYLQYLAAQKAREAQEKTTDAEETRFQVGTSTNYLVVQQQDALTQARLTELQRLISYILAQAQFDLVQRFGGTGGGGTTGGGTTGGGTTGTTGSTTGS